MLSILIRGRQKGGREGEQSQRERKKTLILHLVALKMEKRTTSQEMWVAFSS